MKKVFFGLIIFTTLIASGQDYNFPKEINLVFDYLLKKDYPELFGDQPFQFRPIAWQIIDIDDDGKTEVFLQTFPHYRQSPTITIFQIDKSDSVTRIIEGFVPGHLVKLSKADDYFDPHSTGTAIDMQLDSNEPEKFRKLAESSLSFGMSVILYKNFIHSDKREGKGIFVDLMYLDDYARENSCAKFQFEKPDQIIAGKVKNQEKKFLIAKVGNELFCYKINGFVDSKFVDKEIKIIEIPKDFKELQLDNMTIKYLNKKGQIKDLEI